MIGSRSLCVSSWRGRLPAVLLASALLTLPAVLLTQPAQGQTSQNTGQTPVTQGPIAVPLNDPFIRGDANVDLGVDIADALRVLNFLFPQPPDVVTLPCEDAADANNDESINVADAVYILSYLFSGGAEPPAPFPACGDDLDIIGPVAPALTCASYPACFNDTDPELVGHVLRRVAFGPTRALRDHVTSVGVAAYIDEQLSDAVDDLSNTRLNNLLGDLNYTSNLSDLQESNIARALFSNQQLRQQMTDFWENHFNTYYWSVRGYFRGLPGPVYTSSESSALTVSLEEIENSTLRSLGFSDFRDLVIASATGVPMLIYLDSHLNIAAEPNENYARELLELHTMGVDNGYTQDDIEELSRCLTGWTLCKKAPGTETDPHAPCLPADDATGIWAFHFDPATHDYDAKTLFEGTGYQLDIPARPALSPDGILDGFEVIDWLTQDSSQTAEFISTKLIKKFVSDTPPPSLVAACIATWLTTDGDIQAVLDVILHSDEFLFDHRWNLIETPYEYCVANARAFDEGSLPPGDDEALGIRIRSAMSLTNNRLFEWGTPDGYPSFGLDQLGTSKVLERIDYNMRIFDGFSSDPQFDLVAHLNAAGVLVFDAASIVSFFLDSLYPNNYTAEDEQLALDFINTNELGNPAFLNWLAPDFPDRVHAFGVFVSSFPQSMKQ
ncbi:MAG: DUF1800 family protein [Planctomycetota bacterium]